MRNTDLFEIERAAEVLTQRKDERPIDFYEPTTKQLPFHKSPKPIRFFIGSNQSGKTTAGATEMIWWLCGTHPYLQTPKPPIEAWIVSLDHQQQRDGSQKKILEYIPKEMMVRAPVIQRDIIDFIVLKNGSKITFKSFEAEAEKFAAAVLHCVWIDEEPPEDKYKEIFIRLLRNRGSLWVTMTPLKGISWTYRSYYKPFLEKKDKRVDIFEAEIWDNPYIPIEDTIEEIKRLYTPAEIEARLRGKYTILAGKSVFPKEHIARLMDESYEPVNGFIVEDENGLISFADKESEVYNKEINHIITDNFELYEPPTEDETYVIGADVSEGLGVTDIKRDYSVAVILKKEPLKVVGVFRSNTIREDIFAEVLLKLGLWYNEALIGVEDNSYGKVVNFILANGNEYQEPYTNLYYRESFDEGIRKVTEKVGWRTTFESKQRLISFIRTVLYEQTLILPSMTILEELSTYILDEHGKPIEEAGTYSDCIIALGIALQINESQGSGIGIVFSPSEEEDRLRMASRRGKQPKDHFNEVYKDIEEGHFLLK